MKKHLLTLTLILAIFTLNAQSLLYESFDYAVNDTLPQHGWTGLNTGDSIVVVAGSLDYTGLLPSVGNKIALEGYGRDYQKTITAQTTGTVYMSFILNVTNADNDTTSGYFTGMGASATGFFSTVWTRKSGAGFNLGLNAKSTITYTTWGTDVLPVNTPLFVVVSYEIVAGGTNDIAKMWINPLATTFGQPTAPAQTINIVNGAADASNIDRIFVRQDTPAETPFLEMDEIRVGLTWADVTPAPASVGSVNVNKMNVYPNPATDVINFNNVRPGTMYDIVDITGQIVVNGGQYLGQPVGVGSLHSGMYYLKLYNKEGVLVHSFVKQ